MKRKMLFAKVPPPKSMLITLPGTYDHFMSDQHSAGGEGGVLGWDIHKFAKTGQVSQQFGNRL